MRFLKWFLITIVSLVLVLIVGGFIFLKTFDLNSYKPTIEKLAFEHLGRKLELKGDAYFGVSFMPTVILHDVSLANPDWATNKEMVKADTVKVRVSLLPLLKKQMAIDEVSLIKPEAYLEVAKDGKTSWDFELPKEEKQASSGWLIKSAEAAEVESAKIPDIREILSDLIIKGVVIEDGLVVFYDHKNADPMKLNINTFDFEMDGMSNPITMAWDILFNGMGSSGDAKLGSINELYDSIDEPYPVSLNVKALGFGANVNAKISDVLGSDLRAEFDLTANNPSGNMGAPAVDLTATGAATYKHVGINIVKLDVAKNIITGTIYVDISSKLPHVTADLNSDLINIESLKPATKTSFSLIGDAYASELVPDTAIPYEFLKMTNMDAKVAVKKLVVNKDISANNVSLTATIQDGVLNMHPLNLHFGNGQINLSSVVNANNESVSLKGGSEGVLLQDMSKALTPKTKDAFGIISGGKTYLSIDVKGLGKTARQVVNSLNGSVIAVVDPSVLQSGNLKYFTNNLFSQLLNVLKIDTSKQGQYEMKCAVVRADVVKGVMNFPHGVAVDTSRLTVVGDGTVNLQNDKINMGVRAYGTGTTDVSVTQALSGLVKISGTLKSPSIGLDAGGAVKTAASIALGGPVALGANLLLDRDPAPCYTALKNTVYANHFAKPTGAVAATQGVYQGTTGLVSDGVNKVSDTVTDGVGAVFDGVTNLKNLLGK